MINLSGNYVPVIRVSFVYEEGKESEIVDRWPLMYKQDDDGRLMRNMAGWMRCTPGEVISEEGIFLAKDKDDFFKMYAEI